MTNLENRLDKIEEKLDAVVAINYSSIEGVESLHGDEIELRELWSAIWSGKWIIIAITFIFAVVSVIYSLSLPNVYKSETLLAPAEENSGGGLAGLAGQFGGLASLAGVNFRGDTNDKTTLAIEVLKSREFISKFINKHDLLVPLMATKGWDSNKDKLIIDSSIYDSDRGKWIREPKPPRGAEPTMQEAYEVFIKKISIEQDKKSSFVFISVEFFSPFIARRWVELLVQDINEEIKSRDVAEAKKSVKYLSEQLDKTPLAGMHAVFYDLIEEQTKTIMIAAVRDEYVFKTVDEPVAPEMKYKPKRALICIMMILFGGILSTIFVCLKYVLSRDKLRSSR